MRSRAPFRRRSTPFRSTPDPKSRKKAEETRQARQSKRVSFAAPFRPRQKLQTQMAHHGRIPVLAGNSEHPLAEMLNLQADFFKRFFGKAARDRRDAALIRAEGIVDFAVDLQIFQMIFAEDGRTDARRSGNQRFTDRISSIGIPMDEAVLLSIFNRIFHLARLERRDEHPPDFRWRRIRGQKRKQVAEHRDIPLGKEIQRGSLKRIFPVFSACRDERTQKRFPLINVLLVSELDENPEILRILAVQLERIREAFRVFKRKRARPVQNAGEERRTAHAERFLKGTHGKRRIRAPETIENIAQIFPVIEVHKYTYFGNRIHSCKYRL